MENVLLEVLTETLNISPEELSSTLTDEEGKFKETAKQELLSKYSDHVAAVKSKAKEEGKGWGQREALTGFEKTLAEKFEIENADSLKGLDLINKVIESKTTSVEQTYKDQIKQLEESKGFTEEDIKKSSLFIELEGSLTKAQEAKDQAVLEAVTGLKRQMEEKEVFGSIIENGIVALEKLNPVLSEDPTRRKNQINDLYVSELSKYGYSKLENGEIAILDKETGNRRENAQGHALKMDDLYESIAKAKFDFRKSKDKDFQPDDKNPDGSKIQMPKTEAEFWEYLGNSEIPISQRNKVQAAYESKELKFES